MAIQIGLDVVLEYNSGTDASPTWTEVGFQVTGTLTIDSNTVDTTTKSTSGWSSMVGTFRSWSFSFDGKMDRADAGIIYLENAAINRTEVHVRWRVKVGATATFTGKGVLESWEYSFPVDDAAGFAGTVRGNGALTKA